ncbi:MAG: hypothetical protein WB762_12435 [Candidatus Sulfotelmatobacter sp.]
MSGTINVNIPSGQSLPITIGGDSTAILTDSEVSTDSKIDLKPVKVDTDSKIELKPVKVATDSTIDLKPVKVDTDSKIDLKPVAVDSCTTIKLAPLPPIHVEQPYSTHFGFTYMGMELFGFTMSGKSGTFLSSPPKPQYYSTQMAEPHRPCDDARSEPGPSRPSSGLRVRVNEK